MTTANAENRSPSPAPPSPAPPSPAPPSPAARAVRTVNLAVLFLIELAAIVAVSYWGFTRDVGIAAAWGLGLGAPAVLVVLWALFGSPKASHKTRGAGRVAFETVWFGLAVVALLLAGAPVWALVLAGVVALSKTLAALWRQ